MDRRKFVIDTATALLEQGRFSVNHGNNFCRYRSKDGTKCAIGMHILDSLYVSGMEGLRVTDVFEHYPAVREAVASTYGEMSPADINFIRDVQIALHDNPACNNGALLSVEQALAFMSYALKQ